MRGLAVGALFVILFTAVLLEACSHSTSSSMMPTAPASQQTVGSRRHVKSISDQGEIVSVWANGTQFQINGASCGYEDVTTDSTTLIADNNGQYQLKVGNYAQVTGNGSCSSSIAATQVVLSNSSTFPTTTTLIGQINQPLSGGEFEMQTSVTGGSGCGYVNVYVDPNTVLILNNQNLASGTYAQVFGTGSCTAQADAAQVILSSTTTFTQPTTVAGPITQATGSGTTASFQIQGGTGCGYVNVTQNTTNPVLIANGQTISVGTNAQITASGSCSTSFVTGKIFLSSPAPSPTPSAVASHIPTADRCCGGFENDTPSGGAATAVPFVSYWEPGTETSAQQVSGAGVAASRILTYVDNSNVHDTTSSCGGDYEGTAVANDASTQAVNSSSNTVYGTFAPGTPPACPTSAPVYLTDPWQTDTQTIYQNGSQAAYNAFDGYADIIFEDDIEADEYNFQNVTGHTGPPVHTCNGSSETWFQCEPLTATQYATVIGNLSISGVQYMLNSVAGLIYSYSNQPSMSLFEAEIQDLTTPGTVLGLECEGCFADHANAIIGNATSGEAANNWTYTENAIITLASRSKVAWIQDQNYAATGSASYAGRIFSYASLMLTWDPTYTVYQNAWYDYAAPTQLHVFPEELITAYNANNPNGGAYPSPSPGISALLDSGGAYFREYSNCYKAGTSIGACAFVVNPTTSSAKLPVLKGSYTHTLVISSQSDVLSGGTVSLTGPSPAPSVSPNSAEILLP